MLIADGFAAKELAAVRKVLEAAGAKLELVSPRLGMISGSDGKRIEVTKNFLTTSSIFYDAVYVPGGSRSADSLRVLEKALDFVDEASQHFKPVGATGAGIALLADAGLDEGAFAEPGVKKVVSVAGIVSASAEGAESFAKAFVDAIAQHRHWDRAQP